METDSHAEPFDLTVPVTQFINSLKSTKVQTIELHPNLTKDKDGKITRCALGVSLGAGTIQIPGIVSESFPYLQWPGTPLQPFTPPADWTIAQEQCRTAYRALGKDYVQPAGDTEEQRLTSATQFLRKHFDDQQAGYIYGSFELTDFPAAIGKVVSAISHEKSRFTMNGALFENKGKHSVLVATDGYRLHLSELRASKPPVCAWNVKRTSQGKPKHGASPEPVTKILIPKKAMIDIAFTFTDEFVRVFVNQDKLCFEQPASPRRILARKLTGNFPDYQRVMPKLETMNLVHVDPAALIACIKQVKPFTDVCSHALRLDIEHAELKLSASVTEGAYDSASMQLPTNGVELHARYNADYLLDVLEEHKKEPDITFYFTDKNSPVAFSVGDFTAVVMPIRI